jgi:protease-4
MTISHLASITLSLAVVAASAPAASKLAYIKLEGPVIERTTAPILPFAVADDEKTLSDIIAEINLAAEPSEDIDALVIRLDNFAPSRTQIEEIGAAIDRVREQDRTVHVFTEIYTPASFLIAAHADDVIVQSGGGAMLSGFHTEEMYLADALNAVGIHAEFVQIGDFKGAMETIANSGPSPEWDRNFSALLDGLYDEFANTLEQGRGLSRDQLELAMSQCFIANPETAMRLNLIDHALDRPDLEAFLEEEYGEDFVWDNDLSPSKADGEVDYSQMSFFEAFAMMMDAFAPPPTGPVRDSIAVVYIDGAIVDGESSPGGLMSSSNVGSTTIRKALLEIESDDRIKGVVVRIDSPGGSAIASESVWLGLRRVAENKPVWVSVGSMAASGGYYIAVAGDKIYVNPSSIVGSIGVISGKLSLQGLFDKVHLNVVSRSRGKGGDMFSMASAWTPEQRETIRERMTEVYELFTARVSQGRKGISIADTAEGRLFEGRRAITLNMADELGGIEDAITDLAAELELADGRYDILQYPPQPTLEQMLSQAFGMGASTMTPFMNESAELIKAMIGENGWNAVRQAVSTSMQLRRDPILLTAPKIFWIK